ncbi:hypothetical protein BT96DRAFT_1006287 [Gymnopus androsaceus JB14]|uniref:NAD-specific glutamate dehydrogenase second domain-containing protein n=1 Tax=Gymnopus androsaceus JB14 TaxID=1447944 RepID=A0A6A4GLQ7_9AGAR|nr:hypothetical protein BT96DRAFT_1006287 [Gymnopus androsaceus JB14]
MDGTTTSQKRGTALQLLPCQLLAHKSCSKLPPIEHSIFQVMKKASRLYCLPKTCSSSTALGIHAVQEATYACENPSVSLCCAEKIVSLGSASWRLKNALDENDPAHAEVLTNIKRSFRSEMLRGRPSIIIRAGSLVDSYVNFAMIHYPHRPCYRIDAHPLLSTPPNYPTPLRRGALRQNPPHIPSQPTFTNPQRSLYPSARIHGFYGEVEYPLRCFFIIGNEFRGFYIRFRAFVDAEQPLGRVGECNPNPVPNSNAPPIEHSIFQVMKEASLLFWSPENPFFLPKAQARPGLLAAQNVLDKNDPAHSEVLNNIKRRFREETFTRESIEQIRLLYVNFAMVHYPASDQATELMPTLSYQRLQTIQPLSDEELYDKIRRTVPNKHSLQVLESFPIFNKHILKTNSTNLRKFTLSFRLDPGSYPMWSIPRSRIMGKMAMALEDRNLPVPVFTGKEEQRALVQQEVAAKNWSPTKSTGFTQISALTTLIAVICDHIIALFGAKVLAFPSKLGIDLEKIDENGNGATFIYTSPPGITTTEGPGATCESRIDTLFLDNSKPHNAYRLETFRSAGSISATASQQLRCYFVSKCVFPDAPAAKDAEGRTNINSVSDKGFLEKASENTLEITKRSCGALSNGTDPSWRFSKSKARERDVLLSDTRWAGLQPSLVLSPTSTTFTLSARKYVEQFSDGVTIVSYHIPSPPRPKNNNSGFSYKSTSVSLIPGVLPGISRSTIAYDNEVSDCK